MIHGHYTGRRTNKQTASQRKAKTSGRLFRAPPWYNIFSPFPCVKLFVCFSKVNHTRRVSSSITVIQEPLSVTQIWSRPTYLSVVLLEMYKAFPWLHHRDRDFILHPDCRRCLHLKQNYKYASTTQKNVDNLLIPWKSYLPTNYSKLLTVLMITKGSAGVIYPLFKITRCTLIMKVLEVLFIQ